MLEDILWLKDKESVGLQVCQVTDVHLRGFLVDFMSLKPKFSFKSCFWKPPLKENVQMWHTHLHKFLLVKVNFHKQNEFYCWKFSFTYGELWLASQKHVTLLTGVSWLLLVVYDNWKCDFSLKSQQIL